MKAVRYATHGGPEVLQPVVVDDVVAGPGQVLVRHTAIGVNFADCYHRSGLYPTTLPGCPGLEGVGIVEATGPGVVDVACGERVAYRTHHPGSYATHRAVDVDSIQRIPAPLAHIDDATIAAAYLKAMTAEYLCCRLFPTGPEHTALVTAAAGGVGQMLVRVLKHRGARVVAVVGSEAKRDIAQHCGADVVHVARAFDDALADTIRGNSDGGVDVVFDSVGHDTYPGVLDTLRRRGLFVSFGNASGPLPPVSSSLLAQKGSLFFTRPRAADWVRTRAELQASSTTVFEWLGNGVILPVVQQRIPLSRAADAHRLLEARGTTGSLVLVPDEESARVVEVAPQTARGTR